MEELAGTSYGSLKTGLRKKRSQSCRRPRPDSHVAFIGGHEESPLMSSAPSDETNDDIPAFDTNPRRKEFSLSQCMSRAASVSESQRDNLDARRNRLNSNRRSTEGVLAPATWRNTSHDADLDDGRNDQSNDMSEPTKEGKVKKLKLKVSGLTRGVNANGGTREGSYKKASRASDDSRSQAKQNLEGNSDDCISPQDKKSGSVRKSKRVPKRRLLDGEFGDEDDDEIRYLEKLKSKSYTLKKEEYGESSMKQPMSSRVSNAETAGKRKSRLEKVSKDADFEENDDELVESPTVNNREVTLTRRQRALQSSKDPSASAAPPSIVEFPNGLPPAPSRRKQKLSDVEQQLKKEEAAKRRKLQIENAAKESELGAINKILGQDSNRKKREDKLKKRQKDLAQEKAAREQIAASSCIRIIMRPDETTVTFPENMGLPSCFNSKPASYPPPREKCAGPSCNNPYKYRDSKTNLPLCSLQCYKAVKETVQPETISSTS